jgi:hypothetical protein
VTPDVFSDDVEFAIDREKRGRMKTARLIEHVLRSAKVARQRIDQLRH